MVFQPKTKTADAPKPDANAAIQAEAVTSPAIEPQEAPSKNVVEVTVNSTDQQVSEVLNAAGRLAPLDSVIQMVDAEREVDLMEMPPECEKGYRHPVYRFVWVPVPYYESDKATFQNYLSMGYAVCNRDTPANSFWASFQKKNPKWKFHPDGSIRCQNNVLMVTYQEAFKRREQKRLDISRDRNQNHQGIQNYGTDERNLPAAMKGNQMAAGVHPDGAVEASPALQEVLASAAP
jgi:hypothetical protein